MPFAAPRLRFHRLWSTLAAIGIFLVFLGIGLTFYFVLDHTRIRDRANEFYRLATIQSTAVQSFLDERSRVATVGAAGLGSIDSIFNRKAFYEILATAAGVTRVNGQFPSPFDQQNAVYFHRFTNPGLRQQLDEVQAMYDPNNTETYIELEIYTNDEGQARARPFNASAVDEALINIHNSRVNHTTYLTAALARQAPYFFNQFANPPTNQLWTRAAAENKVVAGFARATILGYNALPVIAPVWQPSGANDLSPYNVSLSNWRGILLLSVWNTTTYDDADFTDRLFWRFIEAESSFVFVESPFREPATAKGPEGEPLQAELEVTLLERRYKVIVYPTEQFIEDFRDSTPFVLLLVFIGIGLLAALLTLWGSHILRQRKMDHYRAMQHRMKTERQRATYMAETRAHERVLGYVHHEIRNPLNALVGTVELLSQEVVSLPDDAKEHRRRRSNCDMLSQGPSSGSSRRAEASSPIHHDDDDENDEAGADGNYAGSPQQAEDEGGRTAEPEPLGALAMPSVPAAPMAMPSTTEPSQAATSNNAPTSLGLDMPGVSAAAEEEPRHPGVIIVQGLGADEDREEKKEASPAQKSLNTADRSGSSSQPLHSEAKQTREESGRTSEDRRSSFSAPGGKQAMMEYLTMMRAATDRMAHHLNDMMDLSRLQKGQLPLNPHAVDVRSTLLSLIIPLQREAKVPIEIDIDMTVNSDPVLAVIDETRFAQAASNAIVNAIKYTTEGHITVSCGIAVGAAAAAQLAMTRQAQQAREQSFVSSDDSVKPADTSADSNRLSDLISDRLLQEATAPGGTVGVLQLTVEDTGMGLRGLSSADLFRPFVAMTSPDKQDEQSSGLGLSICALIAAAMHGGVMLEDTGNGCRFTFTVPVEYRSNTSTSIANTSTGSSHKHGGTDSDTAGPEQHPYDPRTHTSKGPRLLVVDDDHTNVKLVGRMLKKLGCDIDTIATGPFMALIKQRLATAGHIPTLNPEDEGFEEEPPSLGYDAVFLDIRLGPTESGTKIAQTLIPQCSDPPPFIAMTANTRAVDIQEYKDAGFVGLVAKPVSLHTLKEALNSIDGANDSFQWFQ